MWENSACERAYRVNLTKDGKSSLTVVDPYSDKRLSR
jgi:hypothetical protein